MRDIECNAAVRRLKGHVDPAGHFTVELHLVGGTVVTETDELGRFTFEGVLPGPVSLVFRLSEDEVPLLHHASSTDGARQRGKARHDLHV